MLLLQSLLDHVGLMDYVGGCHCYAPTYFTCVFPHSLFGSFKKNPFSFDQWLFCTSFNPPRELSVSIETSCGASSFSLIRQVFFSNGAGRDHGLDRHNSDLVFLSSSHQ